MEILMLPNGPFMVNSYLVINKESGKGFIIDPGNDIQPLFEKIENDNIIIDGVVATHGHIDHIEGVSIVKDKFDVPFYINELDRELIDTMPMHARMFGISEPGELSFDRNLPSTGEIEIAGFMLTLLHTPGHSRGSVSIKINEVVFSGDSLFNFSIGRTDLPGGDYRELISSIREKLFVLPDETKVLSGHGPQTTIGAEKRMNPFFE